MLYILFISSSWHQQIISQQWSLNQLHFLEFRKKLKARVAPNIDKRFKFHVNESFSGKPYADKKAGFYTDSLTVRLFSDEPNAQIFYTVDGSIPTKNALRYIKPIKINKNKVLRFRSFCLNKFPSEVVTKTYLVNVAYTLPILSLVTDPVNLWNKYSGIYKNPKKHGRKWERAAHLETFRKDGTLETQFPLHIRIHGGYSRSKPKKSFRLIYDVSEVEGTDKKNIFKKSKKHSERQLVLRAGGSNEDFRLRDEVFQTLYAEVSNLHSPFELCVLYLNGAFWGIYNIRKRIDQRYIREMEGPGNYNLIYAFFKAVDGDTKFLDSTFHFLKTHDLTLDENFKQAQEFIDTDNMMDFWLFNIYFGNIDWPHNNVYMFRDSGPWRYISWDADATFDISDGFGLQHNTLAWALRDTLRHDLRRPGRTDNSRMQLSTFIFSSLIKNQSFREKFITRFLELVHNNFQPQRIEVITDSLINLSKTAHKDDLERWGHSDNAYWHNVEMIKNFAYKRSQIISEYFEEEFHIDLDDFAFRKRSKYNEPFCLKNSDKYINNR